MSKDRLDNEEFRHDGIVQRSQKEKPGDEPPSDVVTVSVAGRTRHYIRREARFYAKKAKAYAAAKNGIAPLGEGRNNNGKGEDSAVDRVMKHILGVKR